MALKNVIIKIKKKTKSIKTNSSSEKSITEDTDSDEEDENQHNEPTINKPGKIDDDICYLKIK